MACGALRRPSRTSASLLDRHLHSTSGVGIEASRNTTNRQPDARAAATNSCTFFGALRTDRQWSEVSVKNSSHA